MILDASADMGKGMVFSELIGRKEVEEEREDVEEEETEEVKKEETDDARKESLKLVLDVRLAGADTPHSCSQVLASVRSDALRTSRRGTHPNSADAHAPDAAPPPASDSLRAT